MLRSSRETHLLEESSKEQRISNTMEICLGETKVALLLGQRGVYRREECNIEARSLTILTVIVLYMKQKQKTVVKKIQVVLTHIIFEELHCPVANEYSKCSMLVDLEYQVYCMVHVH